MRISDWSSDVCSSDLLRELDVLQRLARKLAEAVLLLPVAQPIIVAVPPVEALRQLPHRRIPPRPNLRQNTLHHPPTRTVSGRLHPRTTRKRAATGKRVSVSVVPGGRRILKKHQILAIY